MDKIFHSLIGTYCFHNNEQLILEETATDLSSVSGYATKEINQKFQNGLLWMILPEDRPLFFQALNKQLPAGDDIEIIFRIRHKVLKL